MSGFTIPSLHSSHFGITFLKICSVIKLIIILYFWVILYNYNNHDFNI